MSDLIERARLTEGERHYAVVTVPITDDMPGHASAVQRVADAQLRKALLVVQEWLDERRAIGDEPSEERVALYRETHPDLGVNENVEVA